MNFSILPERKTPQGMTFRELEPTRLMKRRWFSSEEEGYAIQLSFSKEIIPKWGGGTKCFEISKYVVYLDNEILLLKRSRKPAAFLSWGDALAFVDLHNRQNGGA